MPAECSTSDAHPLEDWDVVDLDDLPCHDKILPNGSEPRKAASTASSTAAATRAIRPQLIRTSGSVGSRSILSSLAHRVARVFNVNSNNNLSNLTNDAAILASERDSTSTNSSVLLNDRRRHNSSDVNWRPRQLLVSDLSNYMDHVGCITMRAQLKRDVFERGIDALIRPMVWPILLGVYPPAMTQNERVAWMKRRGNDYLHLRSEWQNLLVDHHHHHLSSNASQQQQQQTPSRAKSLSPLTYAHDPSYLRSIVTAVRKDAIRTDRTHRMFVAEGSQWTTALFNLLVTYAFAHPSIGYCQGMSDLAAPLLVVMRDEASAYVCFCALMVRMRRHFSPSDDSSIASKFTVLALLLRHYCPRLHRFLVNQGADDLLFAYRWLFLEMKREFPLDDCLRMLEVIWAAVPDQYLQSASVELALAETDYRRRAAVLTGEHVGPSSSKNNQPGAGGSSDSEPTISEPPLFDPANNPTPPRRLISCATAARCGSQYYLDGHGVRHCNPFVSSSLFPIPVAHGRTVSDCNMVAGNNINNNRHPSSYQAVSLEPYLNRFRHGYNRAGTATRQTVGCCCQPTPSFQRLILRGYDETNNGGNRSAPVTTRLSSSSNRGRRLLRKRRTASIPISQNNIADSNRSMTPLGPEIIISRRQTVPIFEGHLDTTTTDDSAVGGGAASSSQLHVGGSSNATTESEAEQQVNRDGVATASSAEYDASSEYGGDEDGLDDEDDDDSNSGSLFEGDGGGDKNSDDFSMAQQSALLVALNDGGSSTAEMSVTTRQNPASPLSPLSNVPSTPLNFSNNSSGGGLAGEQVDADVTHCSQAEEAILAINEDSTMDDTCEVATEAILSPCLNTSTKPAINKEEEHEQFAVKRERCYSQPPLARLVSFASSTVTTLSSNSHYQADSGLLQCVDLVTSEDEDVELPTPHELGDSPFVVFVALTLLLQHRNQLLEGHKDYNEIHIYFDKLVRKHNVETVLSQARRIYNAFLNGKSAGSGGGSSSNNGLSALFGIKRTKKRQPQQQQQLQRKEDTGNKSRRSSP